MAATKLKDSAGRALSAVSFQRTAFGVIFVTSPRNAEKLQIKNLSAVSVRGLLFGEESYELFDEAEEIVISSHSAVTRSLTLAQTLFKLTLMIFCNDNVLMLMESAMSMPRNVSKRIADRLKRNKAVVVIANNKGKASRVFGLEEYLEKSKLAKSVQPWKYRKQTEAPDPLGAVEGRILSSLSREEIYSK